MIFLIFVFAFALCEAKPGYSDSTHSGNDIGKETTSSGTGGQGFGYSGSFSGAGGLPSGNIPSFAPFIPQFDFSSFFEQLNRQHQEFIRQFQTFAHQAQGNADAQGSSTQSGDYGGSFGLGNRGGFVGGYGGGFSGPDGNSFSFSGPIGDGGLGNGVSFASGSIGPGGAHQSAAVYPENPNAPNVNTRFASVGGGGPGGADIKSVFTSSESVSTNVGGKPQTFRKASTTINDNGKITTYSAHNP